MGACIGAQERVKGIGRPWLSCTLFIFEMRKLRPKELNSPAGKEKTLSLSLGLEVILTLLLKKKKKKIIIKDLDQKYMRHGEGHQRGIKQHTELNNLKCLVTLKPQVHGQAESQLL